ncbi:MAG: hypothetical protein GX556_04975 [Fibrobacter sp.]|nr:hypothetical protein [Fibrobacter sp.]
MGKFKGKEDKSPFVMSGMKPASQAHHTTAAIWFRFAPPKFLLHCVSQKLHIAATRYVIRRNNLFSTTTTDVMPLKNGIHLRIVETGEDGFLLLQE